MGGNDAENVADDDGARLATAMRLGRRRGVVGLPADGARGVLRDGCVLDFLNTSPVPPRVLRGERTARWHLFTSQQMHTQGPIPPWGVVDTVVLAIRQS